MNREEILAQFGFKPFVALQPAIAEQKSEDSNSPSLQGEGDKGGEVEPHQYKHDKLDYVLTIKPEDDLSEIVSQLCEMEHKRGEKEGNKKGYDSGLKFGKKYKEQEIQRALGIKSV